MTGMASFQGLFDVLSDRTFYPVVLGRSVIDMIADLASLLYESKARDEAL